MLERISLDVASGSFVTMVGASGCGKTTFLRMLLGVEAPTRGRITVDGAPLRAEPDRDRGIVFQRYSVFPHLTVLGNVVLGLEFAAARALGRLVGARQAAGAARRRRDPAACRPRPRAQRLARRAVGRDAAAPCHRPGADPKPRMLLLDEPFGALDPGIRNDMHELITRLWRETGMTVFMVTHDIGEAFKLGTRVLTFDRVRRDPQEPDAFGATITYDLGLQSSEVPRSHGHRHRAACVAGRPDPPGSLPGARRHHHPELREARTARAGRRSRPRASCPSDGWRKEQQWALDMGLPGSESLTDRTIPTFARGELPHFAGINTFLKAPYVENVRDVGNMMPPCSASRSTAAPPTGPAPGSGRRASGGSPPSTRPTITSSASTCASR